MNYVNALVVKELITVVFRQHVLRYERIRARESVLCTSSLLLSLSLFSLSFKYLNIAGAFARLTMHVRSSFSADHKSVALVYDVCPACQHCFLPLAFNESSTTML